MTLVHPPPVHPHAGPPGYPSPPGPLDEQLLVERARSGSDGERADAFAKLYRLYLPRIHAFAYRRCGSREIAEDVTAATFERALRSLESFRWPRGAPSDGSQGGFGPWLFRICANEIVNHHRADHRARGRHTHRTAAALDALAGSHSDSPDNDSRELLPAGDGLLTALATLNPRYQQAISLRYLAGLSHEDAAAAMGATKPVMAVTLHRALRALRKTMAATASANSTEGRDL